VRKICIINHKGGVGKTTACVNIAAGLSREGRKVLIVDFDPQGNVHTSLHFNAKKDIFDLLFNNAEIKECIVPLGKNLDIIPSKETLTKAETLLHKTPKKEFILKQKLKEIEGKYDYVLVDCQPSLGLLNQNAVLYADEAFIPVSTDYLGYDALKKTIEAINDINAFFEHTCQITKIIPTMYDKRNKLAKEMLNLINSNHYGIVADPVRICSKTRESPKLGMSIFKYAIRSRGAEDYGRLVRHITYEEPESVKQTIENRAEKITA
jgi:chromosome partitioning protein